MTTQDKFLQIGTGAVNRTVTSKLGDTINVHDFGATGDGITDDSAAVAAMLTSLSNTVIHFCPRTCSQKLFSLSI